MDIAKLKSDVINLNKNRFAGLIDYAITAATQAGGTKQGRVQLMLAHQADEWIMRMATEYTAKFGATEARHNVLAYLGLMGDDCPID